MAILTNLAAEPRSSAIPSNVVLGYHGCSIQTAQTILGGSDFLASEKPYDWLGHGIYFWEDYPVRAWQWAADRLSTRECPSLIGPAILSGRCLDLTTQAGIQAVNSAYEGLKQIHLMANQPLPVNGGRDFGLRLLDCAVINHLHRAREKALPHQPYQTVRARFVEGDPLYPNAGFHAKTHTQLCVRDSSCILGIFRIPKMQRELLDLPNSLYGEEAIS
jgi:hypothetical protein